MKSKLLLVLAATVMFQINIYSQSNGNPEPQKKIALVIGNGNYKSSVLANPENDGKAIAAVLQKLGFAVLSYSNLEQKEMKKAIDDFSLMLEGADVALFFYAGHGVQSGGLNYLIPVDATLQSEASVEYDCVPADRVMAIIDDSGARIKIMILDACRNNPFERSWTRAASGKGLALMKASSNTFIAYSTSPGSTASDGSGSNSLYTSALLESIAIPDLTIDQMFMIVGRVVSQKSDNLQVPWKSSSLIEDFYFNREKSTTSPGEEVDYFLDPREVNNYKTIKIGNQLWTKRNLNYISFNNGDTIPEIKDPASWSSTKSPATCVYNNSLSNGVRYGRLYNYYAVSDIRNLCPAGWHIPANDPWDILISELDKLSNGGNNNEPAADYWSSPNTVANANGFSVLPSGLREEGSDYKNLGSYAGFYTAEGFVKYLNSGSASFKTDSSVSYSTALSVRCVKGRNPLASTDSANGVFAIKATLNGKVNPNLAFTIISFEYGVSKSYGQSIIANQSPATGSVPVIVDAVIPDLKPGTLYHFRVKAENIAGVTYGSDQVFKTLETPDAVTEPATSISAFVALLKGSVNAKNAKTIVTFEYGTTPDYGNTVTASQSPVSGNETISVNYGLSSLSENTLYHFRIRAESVAGIAFGNDQTFSTLKLPVAKTDSATAVASLSATLRATVNSSNLPTNVSFEYGSTADYGQSINSTVSTIQSISDIPVSIALTGLTSNETYHYRVKASNIAGITYGNDMTFTTSEIIFDVDGNFYNTLTVGNQLWMAENLRTTKFNDGTSILQVIVKNAWSRLKKPGYCWYNNDTLSANVTGALYNWYAVNTFKLCPIGWHVPGKEEWSTLVDYLGGPQVAGGKLKEAGTIHWQQPNYGATNESGFNALPEGIRNFSGSFDYFNYKGQWWSADDSTKDNAWFQYLDFASNSMTSFYLNKTEGYSVRCIKEKKAETPVKETIVPDNQNFIIDPRDEQKYQIVHYGKKIWMAENLKATRFNDNTEIPQVIDKIAWTRLGSPAYCWYENQEAYSTYGVLYNWYAVSSGKLCPVGWHIPSDEEWNILVDRFGGASLAGNTLKEPGTSHWEKSTYGDTPGSYFNALPGGLRNESGEFNDIGKYGYFWGFLKDNKPTGRYRFLEYSSPYVSTRNFNNKPVGLSVRCIKD
jgi:uncharacterized protein (TIGR02145 family)